MDVYLDDSGEEQLYYVSAQDAAAFLSRRHKRKVLAGRVCKLAKRKKQPVRTYPMGHLRFYCLEDLEQVTIKQKSTPD